MVEKHWLWMYGQADGQQANFSGMDLHEIDLSEVDLSERFS